MDWKHGREEGGPSSGSFHINMPATSITLCDGQEGEAKELHEEEAPAAVDSRFPILFTESPPVANGTTTDG